ncbi:MAG: hypothetical protein Q7T82_21050 [Armatimonadota bacterium]|nr:hypothetical protein [Armatimonadota bacterium]
MAGPPPAAPPGYGPTPPPGAMPRPAPPPSMPVGLILLTVLEGLLAIFLLISLISLVLGSGGPAQSHYGHSMPAVQSKAISGVIGLVALCLAGFALYGFIRRLSAARIAAIVQSVLHLLLGLLVGGLGVLTAIGAAAMRSNPGMIPGGPGMPNAGSSLATGAAVGGAILIVIGGIVIVLTGIIIWYLTTQSVRDWLSQ